MPSKEDPFPTENVASWSVAHWLQSLRRFFVDGQLVIALVLFTFLARLFLADWNSYWLDELLSVNVYGRWHDSALDAVRVLAESSVHPPLYQFTLYNWMTLFGDHEIATRSLSNLYIALATLFLYLGVRTAFSRYTALASAAMFAVMYTPTYYGMEARSYAQTMFLASLSSYALIKLMAGLGNSVRAKHLFLSPVMAVFVAANVGLLLTHYYNVFFWAAQGIFALLYVLLARPLRSALSSVAAVVGTYGLQAALFFALWGHVLLETFGRHAGAYGLQGEPEGPLALLVNSILRPNLADPPVAVLWIGAALAVAMALRAVWAVSRDERGSDPMQGWTKLYLVAWMLLPFVVVSITFATVGVERYSHRYFAFSVAPLAPLIVLSIQDLSRAFRMRVGRHHLAMNSVVSALLVSAVMVAFVLPSGLNGATERKHDWRGIVRRVVEAVGADARHDYIIYETAHRRRPMTNYYFERLSDDVRAFDTIQRYEERNGRYRILEEDEPIIAEHDRLVVVFTHQRTRDFRGAIEQLEERYEVRHRQLSRAGRGFIVFDIDQT
jgi:uncharacterized membrane protein